MESSYYEAYVSDWRDGAFYLNRKFGQGSASNSGIPRPMRIKGDSSLICRYSERFSSILRGEKKCFLMVSNVLYYHPFNAMLVESKKSHYCIKNWITWISCGLDYYLLNKTEVSTKPFNQKLLFPN